MTREEAIESLRGILTEAVEFENSVCYVTEEDREPLEMAIQALEKEPCENAISREDALMCLTGEWTEITDEIIHRFIKRIKALPPVNPQPKTGKWIDSPNGYFTHCSECGLHGDKGIYKHYGWCPKCGARMIELQESENK